MRCPHNVETIRYQSQESAIPGVNNTPDECLKNPGVFAGGRTDVVPLGPRGKSVSSTESAWPTPAGGMFIKTTNCAFSSPILVGQLPNCRCRELDAVVPGSSHTLITAGVFLTVSLRDNGNRRTGFVN